MFPPLHSGVISEFMEESSDQQPVPPSSKMEVTGLEEKANRSIIQRMKTLVFGRKQKSVVQEDDGEFSTVPRKSSHTSGTH